MGAKSRSYTRIIIALWGAAGTLLVGGWHAQAVAAPAEVKVGSAVVAPGLAGSPCQTGCCLPVRVVLNQPRSTSLVEAVLRIVEDVWASYGVGFFWTIEPPRPAQPAQLRVIVDEDGEIVRHGDGRLVMASIPFLEPGRPHSAIRASFSAAREFVRATLRAAPPSLKPWIVGTPAGPAELLTRSLGRSIAHEIGHYLTANSVHAQTGLMRSHFGVADLVAAGPDVDHMTPDDVSRMWRPDGVLSACARTGSEARETGVTS